MLTSSLLLDEQGNDLIDAGALPAIHHHFIIDKLIPNAALLIAKSHISRFPYNISASGFTDQIKKHERLIQQPWPTISTQIIFSAHLLPFVLQIASCSLTFDAQIEILNDFLPKSAMFLH